MNNNKTLIWIKDEQLFNNYGLIKNMAVILDKVGGLVSYGDIDFVEEKYNTMINACRSYGFKDVCNDLILINFSEKINSLTINEIGTFVNYMLSVSANGNEIFNILNYQKEEIKKEIQKLSNNGFEIDNLTVL